MRTVRMRASAFFLLALSACSISQTPAGNYIAAAGGGALAGAATGAAVGGLLSNGDIGKSALLGSAIGLPAGLLLQYLLSDTLGTQKKLSEREQFMREVRKNQSTIKDRQPLLEDEWERVHRNRPHVKEPHFKRPPAYKGNTFQNPRY
jgi:hypothetical protein